MGYPCSHPRETATAILDELHCGHPGIVRMKSLARMHVFWPGLDQHIERVVQECSPCQVVQPLPAQAPVNPWAWPSHPWHCIHVDFAGPFLDQMFLLVVDAHSKWPEVIPMKSTTASNTIRVLRSLFSKYGLPNEVVSDNGPQFVAEEFAEFLKKEWHQAHQVSSQSPSFKWGGGTFRSDLQKGYEEGQVRSR